MLKDFIGVEVKIRTGFVSNSSSSSFLAVGIHTIWGAGNTLFEKMLERMEWDKDSSFLSQGIYEYNGLCLYGSSSNISDLFFIGVDAEVYFNQDMKLSDIIQIFIETVREKLGINIDKSLVGLFYGECGS